MDELDKEIDRHDLSEGQKVTFNPHARVEIPKATFNKK